MANSIKTASGAELSEVVVGAELSEVVVASRQKHPAATDTC